ncbi:MAG: helix-turn-helix domain-containing protein [Hyalangium sp.]|uniref:helix-turn-helix domain-containing protein n=1 Tax=Hyalangium sp. TaxID=2028555 RepID=UPI00389B1F3D
MSYATEMGGARKRLCAAMPRKTHHAPPRPQQRAPARKHPWITAFGAAVRAARVRKGLSQAQTARHLGMTPSVYGRVERGLLVPGVMRLYELCQLLEVSPDTLLVLEYGAPSPTYRRWRTRVAVKDSTTPAMRSLLTKARQLSPAQLRRLSQIAALLFE